MEQNRTGVGTQLVESWGKYPKQGQQHERKNAGIRRTGDEKGEHRLYTQGSRGELVIGETHQSGDDNQKKNTAGNRTWTGGGDFKRERSHNHAAIKQEMVRKNSET